MLPVLTYQNAPVQANAGNQFTQIVSVDSPTNNAYALPQASPSISGPLLSPTPSGTFEGVSWGIWALMAAIAYFGLSFLEGRN